MKNNFLARLDELRGDRSVTEFARFLGIPQKTLDNYMREERKPSIGLVEAICTKCFVSSDWLLGLNGINMVSQNGNEIDWQSRALEAEKKLASIRVALKNVTAAVKVLEEAI